MAKPEALRLADELIRWDFAITRGRAAAELRRLHAENASLAAALASSCDEQRHQLWESGGIAGCERARVAERQRDALLEALQDMVSNHASLSSATLAFARGVIAAVEGEKICCSENEEQNEDH